MGKGGSTTVSAPAADYTPVANSSIEAAQMQQQQSAAVLAESKREYDQQAPLTQAYMNQMINNTNQQTWDAEAASQRYASVYQPVENSFVNEAQNYNSANQTLQNRAQAEGDVSAQFNAQRQSSLQSLESYGIDPSQTRYGALDLGTRVSQAAATAAAGTQSGISAQATGMALQEQAISIGRGYPSQVSADYTGAANSGAQGISAANQTASTYGNLMGTATQWGSLANSSNGTAIGAYNGGYGAATGAAQVNQANASNQSSGIGSLIGGAVGIAAIAV